MLVEFDLKKVEVITINKNVKCKDCDSFLNMRQKALVCYYKNGITDHSRIICGCTGSIPIKVEVDVKVKEVETTQKST